MLDNLVAILTILTSLLLVLVIIGTAWWLMWKVCICNSLLFKYKPMTIAGVSVKVPVY